LPGFFPSLLTFSDPDTFNYAADLVDATRVIVLDCDNNGCDMVDGTKDGSGWHYTNRVSGEMTQPGSSPDRRAKILMMEIEDIE